MKGIKILILLLFVSILSGCSRQTSVNEAESTAVDLFPKQQKCLGYRDNILSDLKEIESKSGRGKYTLEQIFYSPSRNKCFFVRTVEYSSEGDYERRLYEYGNHSYHSEAEFVCSYYFEDNKKVDNRCAEMDKMIESMKK